MAAGRMFNINLCESDAFLNLSNDEKVLYFYLSLSADDDGVIAGGRKALMLSGTTQSALDSIIKSGFILSFDDGNMLVITHWKVSNHIRSDRYTPSRFQNVLSLLTELEDGSYTITPPNNGISDSNDTVYQSDTKGIPNGYTEKDREEKIKQTKINKESVAEGKAEEFEGMENPLIKDFIKQCYPNCSKADFKKLYLIGEKAIKEGKNMRYAIAGIPEPQKG